MSEETTIPEPRKVGTRGPLLKPKEIRLIRSLRRAGKTNAEIAVLTNRSHGSIGRACRGMKKKYPPKEPRSPSRAPYAKRALYQPLASQSPKTLANSAALELDSLISKYKTILSCLENVRTIL